MSLLIARENRRSLAIFFAEEIAHVGALKNRAILRGSGKNRRRNRRESRDFGALRGGANNVPLANGGCAGVTPAVFVIFVGFRCMKSEAPCFDGQKVNPHFRHFSSKTACFRQGTKTPFSRSTVFTTLKLLGVQTPSLFCVTSWGLFRQF